MNKILLTGPTGFIGTHFLQYLLNQNYTVRVLVRSKQTNFPRNIEVFHGDLTDPISLKNCCAGIDTVFHLAGYAHAWGSDRKEFKKQHHEINFQGTQNLLQEAIAANVKKFIYFSSVKAVADSENFIDETWNQEPNSPYGIAKREAEKLVLAAKDMHTTVIRPSLVYGPNWKGNLANMLRAIDKGLFPPLPETNNRRSMISVADLCQAALLAANSPEANGKIYFVTDQNDYSTRQLYNLMCRALGKSVPNWNIPLVLFKGLAFCGDVGKKITGLKFPFNSEGFAKLFGSAQYNSALISKELNFKPAYTLETMLPQIVNAYRKQHANV